MMTIPSLLRSATGLTDPVAIAASSQPSSRGRSGARPARLDRIDRRIVTELQRDATIPLARLAERVGLSQTPCWKRVQRLEQTGVLTGRVALADPEKLGLGLCAFVSIAAGEHGEEWRSAFLSLVEGLPEVVEVWRVAGDADYILRVLTTDMAAYDAFYRQLTASLTFRGIVSQFALERVAHTTAIPLPPEQP